MEFSIDRDELIQALYLTQGIVERRTTIPILANILVESTTDAVIVAATDQEVGVRRKCSAQVQKKGSLTTGARKLYEIVRECPPGVLTIRSSENNWIELAAGKSRFKMVGLDPKQFPAMPAKTKEHASQGFTLTAAMLKEMIERVQFAVSTDETRPNLSGLYFERPEPNRVRLVATDGHRLSMVTRTIEAPPTPASGVIVPRKGVAEIQKVIESGNEPVQFSLEPTIVHASRGNVELSMRLVEGEFPDYSQVIPENSARRFTLALDPFLAALRRVSVVSSERTRGVKMLVEAGRVEVSAINPDLGEATDEMSIEYDGKPLTIGFNAKYFLDVLSILPVGETVEIGMNEDVNPVVLRMPSDPDFLYVVMPMRL